MQVILYEKDQYGLPTATVKEDLTRKLIEEKHTTGAFWGPINARMRFTGSFDDAYRAADEWLGCPIEIRSDNDEWCWEGQVWTVGFGYGNRRRTRSLENYAQWGLAFYSPPQTLSNGKVVSGVTATQPVGPMAYQMDERYPAFTLNLGSVSGDVAVSRGNAELARRGRITWLPDTGSSQRVSQEPVFEIECVGWYRRAFLSPWTDQIFYSGIDPALLIQQIIFSSCPYWTQNFDFIEDTGDLIDVYPTTYPMAGELIKELVLNASAELTDTEFIFGLQQDRTPYLRKSKRASTTPDYYERSNGSIRDAAGVPIRAHQLRPDIILQQLDFLPAGTPLGVATDNIENVYVAEVTYQSATDVADYKTAIPGRFVENTL